MARLLVAAFLCICATPAWAQLPFIGPGLVKHTLSAASTNSTSIKAAGGVLYSIYAMNTNATTAFLKISNSASAPTCGTTAVAMTVPLPQNQQVSIPIPNGLSFNSGIGFCITGAIADNDTTNATTGIAVNIAYQ